MPTTSRQAHRRDEHHIQGSDLGERQQGQTVISARPDAGPEGPRTRKDGLLVEGVIRATS